MRKLRILSPRWNAELDRFQLPNEIVEVPDSELPHWAAHTELVVDEQPQPEGAVIEAAPSEPVGERDARPVLPPPVAEALAGMVNGSATLRDVAVAVGAEAEFDAIAAAQKERLDTGAAEFRCQDCRKEFTTARGLATHVRQAHKPTKE